MHPALILAALAASIAGLYLHDCWEHARYLKRITASITVTPKDAHNQRAPRPV